MAYAEGVDPEEALDLYVSAYQNTPHSATGEKPSKLMFGRDIQTKLPQVTTPSTGDHHDRARTKNEEYKKKTKERYDKKRRVKEVRMVPGDRVLIKQSKTTVKPPYDPKLYSVVTVEGTQVTARRGTQEKKRNKMKVKKLPDRPEHLQQKQHSTPPDTDQDSDDEVDINLSPSTPAPITAPNR